MTDDFKRKLRLLGDVEYFKENEKKVWLLYVGPVLSCDLVDSVLYERFHLMSYATNRHLTSRQYANDAERLISLFLKKTEDRNGQEVFTANFHSFNHLTMQVKNHGPLWSSSAIMFESANYLLQTKFNGTVNHLWLVERYVRNKTEQNKVPDNDFLRDFCLSMQKRKNRIVKGSSVKIFLDNLRFKVFNFKTGKKRTHFFFRRSVEIRNYWSILFNVGLILCQNSFLYVKSPSNLSSLAWISIPMP